MKKNLETRSKKEGCDDKKCPFHGKISLRGRIFTGIIVSSKAHKTATVEWVRKQHIPKYERYEKKRTKIHVHNSPCINAHKGDKVKIMETRPLSKTKHFVIIEKIGEEKLYIEKKSLEEEERKKITKETPKETDKNASS